jgi:hypothetical protein
MSIYFHIVILVRRGRCARGDNRPSEAEQLVDVLGISPEMALVRSVTPRQDASLDTLANMIYSAGAGFGVPAFPLDANNP